MIPDNVTSVSIPAGLGPDPLYWKLPLSGDLVSRQCFPLMMYYNFMLKFVDLL